MVLDKLPVPGHPTIWIIVGQGPIALAVDAGGVFGHFYSHLSFLSSFSISLGDGPIQTEILSQRAVKPEINQPKSIEAELIEVNLFIRCHEGQEFTGRDGNNMKYGSFFSIKALLVESLGKTLTL